MGSRCETSEHAPTTILAEAMRPSGPIPATTATIAIEMTRYARAPSFWNVARDAPAVSGTNMAVTSSSGRRTVRRLPTTNAPTGTSRRPPTDTSSTRASSAIRFGSPSAAGEALQTLPQIVPRFWI